MNQFDNTFKSSTFYFNAPLTILNAYFNVPERYCSSFSVHLGSDIYIELNIQSLLTIKNPLIRNAFRRVFAPIRKGSVIYRPL